MIRMIQSNSADHAKAYFSDALQKADYYLDGQELNGNIQGRLAERLDLKGPATKDIFFALSENKNPVTGKQLTLRTKEQRRVGYDINFHCPKSVSVIHALSKDNHVMKAFEESVKETMKDIEADSQTRVRKGGAFHDRDTGELIWADFTHQTARPVDGSTPDPHLHSHCFVFNVTYDATEKEYKAAELGAVKRDMPYYQARFHKRLSDKMMQAGYTIRRTDKSFEIEGVPQKVIDLFSKRTDEIGRVAKEKGITDAKALSELGAKTRAKKDKGLSMAELKQHWRKQIQELGNTEEEGNTSVRYDAQNEKGKLSAERCINHALTHSFERASVMADRRILESAYRYSLGDNTITVDAINETFAKDDRIIHVKEKSRTLCTTKEVLSEEKKMVQLARLGQGKMKPLYTNVPILQRFGQQAEAIKHVLTDSNRVSIIRGAAGAGKTTVMQDAITLIEKTGKKVTVIAPTANASRGVLREEGFEQAETVALFLKSQAMQKQVEDNVIWVDEAGLLGTKDMSDLLEITTKQNARLILGGDTRQHASVIRGDALRILNTVAGIPTAEVNKIYRQKNVHYRKAVEDLSKGQISSGFNKLDALGAIKDVDPLNPNEELVEDYVAALKKGKKALVISPTQKQGEEVTQAIRRKLRQSGHIGKKEITALKLTNLNLTQAEKADWRNFAKGQIILFNQNVPGINRGTSWSVTDMSDKGVTITNGDGQTKLLPGDKTKNYDVFEASDMGLAKGDKIQIRRNGFDRDKKRLNNGQTLEVLSVSKKGKITLQNPVSKTKYTLDKDFGHLAHAHCITSHAAQGKTVDEVFIAQPSATFGATDAKQFYVSVSRAREQVRIYTDDKEALFGYASALGDRQSALELVGKRKSHADYIHHGEHEVYIQPTAPIEKNRTSPIHSPVKEPDYEPGF